MKVNLFKQLGLVLIALPEPFTTPAGMALFGLGHYLSKRQETKNRHRMLDMVGFYLAHAQFYTHRVYTYVPASATLTHHPVKHELLQSAPVRYQGYPWYSSLHNEAAEIHRTIQLAPVVVETGAARSEYVSWRNERVSKKLIHHAIKLESAQQSSPASVPSQHIEKVFHHTLNTALFHHSQSSPRRPADKTIHHTLNEALSRQNRKSDSLRTRPDAGIDGRVVHHTMNQAIISASSLPSEYRSWRSEAMPVKAAHHAFNRSLAAVA